MYLLDTNVVSELRRVRPHGAVLAWLRDVDDTALHISAVTVGEIQTGIEIARERDQAKAAEIEAWLDDVSATFNVIDMDGRTFRWCARMMHRQSNHLIEDAMIAATAQVHNLTVVTRDVRDFQTFGIPTFDPFRFSR